ncbi:MAG TPA: NBR1-Ig-like domain-containing protein [Anaerolineaceae bacterium]|nr:NBR1-Ig-like domain-containing protein [Anaerolineaceae bacterium]
METNAPSPIPTILTILPPASTQTSTALPAAVTPTSPVGSLAQSPTPLPPTATLAAAAAQDSGANPTATPTTNPTTAPTAAPTAAPTSSPATPLSPTPSPAPSATSSVSAVVPVSGCEDKAAYYGDVTIPDNTSFRQGVDFVKTWQIKNAGTCTWGPTYSLVFASGDIMNGPQAIPLPTVNPGDLFNVSVKLTSPANGGTYLGDWEFQRPDGSRFGVNSGGVDFIWVKIVVSYVVVGPTPTPDPVSATCTGQSSPDYLSQVLALINGARSSNGLNALTLNPKLAAAAQAHSKDMACNDFVDHVGSDGSTWFTRIKAQNYKYSYASENIYVGNPAFGGDPQGAFTWWMNSQVHRDNILSPKITEIGIGYAFYDKSTYGGYYTVDFAHP